MCIFAVHFKHFSSYGKDKYKHFSSYGKDK